MNFLPLLLVALLAGLAPRPASAQPARQLLLVVNANSAESVLVGEHYARRHGLPDDAIVRLQVSANDEIPRDEYLARVEAPVSAWFGRHSAQDRVNFIVLTKGVPLRVAGTSGRTGTVASVDSELTLLYRKMTGRPSPVQGFVANPYYAGVAPPAEWRPFSHQHQDIFLVTRLDGFAAGDANGLVDASKAAQPVSAGRIVLDMKAAVDDKGNEWLKQAAERLAQMGLGDRVVLEQTSAVVRDQKDLLAYYSWGSNDPAIRDRDLGNRFVPGGIAGQFVSTDARTFTEPPADWKLGTWEQRATFYAGSPQSLTGDLIRQGVTGVAGQVAEPFLDGSIRPEILIPAYLSGFSLAEAYYLAMPYLSWQAVVVGDPLTTVAARTTPAPESLEPPVDPTTELPAWFSRRRLDAALSPGLKPEAVAAWVRAGTRSAKGDTAGARAALEEAVALDPKVTGAHLLLATMYDEAGESAKAEAAYRAVLAHDPRNVLALNNLAYLLAVRTRNPNEGLPFAERAHALAPGVGNISDTLAWVHHLLGNKSQASRYIADALRSEPNNAEVRLHAAAILLDAGDLEGAKREYAKAVELQPAIAERDEAKAVAGRLK